MGSRSDTIRRNIMYLFSRSTTWLGRAGYRQWRFMGSRSDTIRRNIMYLFSKFEEPDRKIQPTFSELTRSFMSFTPNSVPSTPSPSSTAFLKVSLLVGVKLERLQKGGKTR